MNIEEFKVKVKELGIDINEEQLNQLDIYSKYLIEYNEHTNLTAIKDVNGIYLKHFYDSLTIVKAIDLEKIYSLIDIGTGAGFPGVIIKIFFPHIKVTLIDSNNKKVLFLNNLIEKLSLKDIEAINTRSEEYAKEHLDYYDIATARAVTTLPALIELCLPLVKVGGYFIPLKGNVESELSISKEILEKLNGTVDEKICFSLPYEESTRNILKIKKTGKTPNGYPRTYDKIKKSLKKYMK